MRKEVGTIIVGFGLGVIFLIIQLTLKTIPIIAIIFGYAVGGILTTTGIVLIIIKPKKKDIVRNMVILANEMSQFISERKRYDPSNTPHWSNPKWNSWDESRRNEEAQRNSQNSSDYFTQTMNFYRERFVGKVVYLVEEAQRLGYHDEELEKFYQHPTNTIGLEIVATRLSALAQRIGSSSS